MGKNQPEKLPILDIYYSAFLYMHGLLPEMGMSGTRCIFMFVCDAEFYRLSDLYNSNTKVNCLDFVNALRKLKAQMYGLRDKHQAMVSKAFGAGKKVQE
ncbi:MAG TPA: hypothetical protein DCY12_05470 [Candidatus Atribacteria bacterium]|nr:hypothetical protein [Candidatus Atribacteria bacterium]